MRVCVKCGTSFTTEKKRGRPHTKCESCRGTVPKHHSSCSFGLDSPCTCPPTQLGAWNPQPKKEKEEEKPKRKFKDEPTKGNPRYSRQAFLQYMEEFGVPLGAQAVAQAIKAVDEMVKEKRKG